MKNFIIFLMVIFALPVNATFIDNTPQKTVSVASVLKMRDDSFVTIQGKILKQIGDEKYLFTDGKTEIIIEIDDELLLNTTVTPKDRVQITGEVDKDFNSVKIDVTKIEIIK